MKIAVLGGGFTGLTAAYCLRKKGHEVVLIEKASALGGLARGFKQPLWDWPLEYAYHHIFANDTDIIGFAKEIGYDGVYFKTPHTNSLYGQAGNYRIIPVDSPKDFLQFPLLGVIDKIRAATILAILKLLPNTSLYESTTSEVFITHYMGERMWKVFFEQLFRKKFGKYAGKVSAAFLWARIHKRTRQLGYMRGGFQTFVDYLERRCFEAGVTIRKDVEITAIQKGLLINGERFDRIVSTLPTPVLISVAAKLFPKNYIKRLLTLKYLHALVLVLETDKPIVSDTYWLNICTPDVPAMVIVQQTNFVDKKHYGGNHIAYVGYYLEKEDPRMKMAREELVEMLKLKLEKIENVKFKIKNSYIFKGPFAQPIFDIGFKNRKPDFESPIKGFYIANLDMTYPYDRGTNYAVSLGKRVAEKVR